MPSKKWCGNYFSDAKNMYDVLAFIFMMVWSGLLGMMVSRIKEKDRGNVMEYVPVVLMGVLGLVIFLWLLR